MTDAGFAIVPTASFEEVPRTDTLCIPGGIGVADVIDDDVQLEFEYDPQPPFEAGSPERAGVEMVRTYRERMNKLVPGRVESLRRAAAKRGFS